MSSEFHLHDRLAADTVFVAEWRLCRVLLMNDSRYPWLVLVPRVADVTEIHELSAPDRGILIEEVARAAASLKKMTGAGKMNIGALGNLVPQLHIHVVARSSGDFAWPGPVWGQGRSQAYSVAAMEARLAELRTHL